jgi:hypothetical protein
MKDKIIDNKIRLYNNEVISLEEYFDRVTDPYIRKINTLKQELNESRGKQAVFDGAGTSLENDWDATPQGEQR